MENVDVMNQIDDSTREAHRVQLNTLCNIIQANKDVEYLRIQLQGIIHQPFDDPEATEQAFRRIVSISSYEEQYSELIGRIADGVQDSNALSWDKLICFFNSSGTSSLKPKLIPYFDSAHGKEISAVAHQASQILFRRLVDPIPRESKILWFLYAGNVTETKGGIKVMAASAYPFQNKGTTSPLFKLCVSPPEVIMHSDVDQQMYCHLLCGLVKSARIDGIRAPYAASLVRAIRFLELKWMQLCNDIETGSVSSEITDLGMRNAVERLVVASPPGLVNRIREACGRKNWGGILHVLWPNLRYVACVTTGSMKQYYSILKDYAGENVMLLGGDYFCSECPIGINMDRTRPPELTDYVLLPFVAYFEFLPSEVEASGEVKETVNIAGVEVGKMYEIVVTTYRGFYRYRLGDVVKVVGFYNSSPRLEFISRATTGKYEVITERDLMCAMENFKVQVGNEERSEVVEFAGFVDSDSKKRCLSIFVELSKDSMLILEQNLEESTERLRHNCEIIEDSLGSAYKAKRSDGELSPLKVSLVKPGSFDVVAKAAIDKGAPANQYKPPKIIQYSNVADVLEANVVVSVRPE